MRRGDIAVGSHLTDVSVAVISYRADGIEPLPLVGVFGEVGDGDQVRIGPQEIVGGLTLSPVVFGISPPFRVGAEFGQHPFDVIPTVGDKMFLVNDVLEAVQVPGDGLHQPARSIGVATLVVGAVLVRCTYQQSRYLAIDFGGSGIQGIIGDMLVGLRSAGVVVAKDDVDFAFQRQSEKIEAVIGEPGMDAFLVQRPLEVGISQFWKGSGQIFESLDHKFG